MEPPIRTGSGPGRSWGLAFPRIARRSRPDFHTKHEEVVMVRTVHRSKKRVILALLAVFTFAGGGIAFAYWTSTGTGAGAAKTGTSTLFTIIGQTPVGTIAPGNAGQTVGFTVTNPSGSPQYLTAVTVALAGPTGTPWVPPTGCLIADYTATITTAPPAGDILAGDSVTGTATVTLANTEANQNPCKGADVPLYFTAT
ncbi:hypothetical protein [Amycolatopsis sp. NPDC051128]|uniref:hypothetical protein n=1 Tax=Amycolatopsis sp. NPDC051128 TaxID=3155412 RepID=UPI00341A85C8